jgi:hypothetical protein
MSRPQHRDQQAHSATIVELNINPVVRDAGTNSIDARSKIEIVFEDRSWRFTGRGTALTTRIAQSAATERIMPTSVQSRTNTRSPEQLAESAMDFLLIAVSAQRRQ